MIVLPRWRRPIENMAEHLEAAAILLYEVSYNAKALEDGGFTLSDVVRRSAHLISSQSDTNNHPWSASCHCEKCAALTAAGIEHCPVGKWHEAEIAQERMAQEDQHTIAELRRQLRETTEALEIVRRVVTFALGSP